MNEFKECNRYIVKAPDCNATDNLFGGQMLAWVDESSAVYAMCQMRSHSVVTAAMRDVKFVNPCPRGSVVRIYCKTKKRGTSSMTVVVEAFRQDFSNGGERVPILHTEIVFVNVNGDGKPEPVNWP